MNRNAASFFVTVVLLAGCGSGTSSPDISASDSEIREPSEIQETVGGDSEIRGPSDTDDSVDADVCVSNCVNRECGVDENGLDHGACDDGMTCVDGSCQFIEVPMCDDRDCGDDGVGGLCGVCEGKTVCNYGYCEDACPERVCGGDVCGTDGACVSCGQCGEGYACTVLFQCAPACSYPADLPASWGPVAVTGTLTNPAGEAGTVCFDYDGDGTGDCGTSQLLTSITDVTGTDGIFGSGTALMFEFVGAGAFDSGTTFAIRLLSGEPVTAGIYAGDMLVSPESYDPGSCLPLAEVTGAAVIGDALTAGPATVTLPLRTAGGYEVLLPLRDVRISASIVRDETGVTLESGVLTGILTKKAVDTMLDALDARCDLEPVPADVEPICSYVGVARNAMIGIYDLHIRDDGTYVAKDADNQGDASSQCLKFAAVPGTITGFTE